MSLENPKRARTKKRRKVLNRFGYFILVLMCMVLASIHPDMGSGNQFMNGHVVVWYVAVPLTYLEAGLMCSPKTLYKALTDGYLLCFILAFMYIIMPLLSRISSCLLIFANVNMWLLKGMEVFYCMPPPLGISIALTRLAGGDVATSVVSTLVAHFIGVLVSPLLLYLMLGASTPPLVGINLEEIIYTTIVPFGVGLTLQTILHKFNLQEKLHIGWIPLVSLLVTAYHWFSDAFTADATSLEAVDILLCVLLACLGQIFIISFCWLLCSRWLPKSVSIASLFTIMHKSVGFGGWILRGAYHGSAHGLAINLPLSILPVAQLLLGSLFACWKAP